MASRPELIAFASREGMAARLSDLLETAILRGCFLDDQAEIAVSGGSTPKLLYENLALRALPWRQVGLTLVDERWVPPDHARSNEAFVRHAFAAADGVSITGLYNAAASPAAGLAEIAVRLDARLKKSFDVVILGMGEDGHTASWFPHAQGLAHALDSKNRVCAITAQKNAVTGDEAERMTLTLSAIRDARLIILMTAGESKRKAFESALQSGPVEDMPVRAIMRARPDMWVCWAP